MNKAPKRPAAARPQPSRHWLDLLVGGAAILISAISLWVAIDQGRIQQKMLAAGSWPIVVAETGNVDEDGVTQVIKFRVRNDGEGPALLRRVDVRYNGRPVKGAQDLLNHCCFRAGVDADVNVTTSQLGQSVLAAGKTLDFLVFPRTERNAEVWERLNRERARVTFDACYCSVLGECWRSGLDGGEPKRVTACPEGGGYRE